MRVPTHPFAVLVPALLFATAVLPAQMPMLVAKGLDPVALGQGEEVQGKPEISTDHFLYRYHFANEANRERFLADPERHGVQFGGGCGRMGPLSGRGAPDRWLVHDGRIYLFASEACRDAFRKAPEKFVPPAPPEMPSDATMVQKGRDALVRAVAALGSPDRVAKLQGLRFARRTTTKTDDGERIDTWCRTVRLPLDVRLDRSWGDWRSVTVGNAGEGFTISNGGVPDPLHATGLAELRQQSLAHPVLLLRQLDAPGFQAALVGGEEIDGVRCDLVAVACGEVRCELAVARDGGDVVRQRSRGRGGDLTFTEITVSYRDFKPVDGIRIAHTTMVTVGGQAGEPRSYDLVECDPELPADFFARSK